MSIKILHIISSLTRGGRERQLAQILASTDHDSYPSKLVYFNMRRNSYLDEYGLNGLALKITSSCRLARLRELHQILNRENPDLVYTWGNGESVSIMLLKPFHNFKFINGSLRHGIRLKKISHFFRTLILHLSRNIVANSQAGLKANNLHRGYILYNGIEKKFFEPLTDRKEVRKQLIGISGETTLLISVANLVPYKDYVSVLDILRKLKNEGYSFYYLILGDGPLRKEIEEKIISYGLRSYIQIIGNIENVADYLKISDVFIHSSKGEGCSNAILEAMASGLPIIASRTGGTREIVTEENGLLFEFKDHEQLAEYISFCINNPDKTALMGQKSREIVKRRFTVEIMMKNYYSILNQIIDN